MKTYEAKYPKATECLAKDREVLLAFYDFPAEHWVHIRTTNPIESVFATVRLRHDKTKGSGSRAACLTMVFKLMEVGQKAGGVERFAAAGRGRRGSRVRRRHQEGRLTFNRRPQHLTISPLPSIAYQKSQIKNPNSPHPCPPPEYREREKSGCGHLSLSAGGSLTT